MNSAWAAVLVALFMMLLAIAGLVWRDGRRDGRLDAILEQLTKITGDHEDRIRAIEHPGERHQPAHRRR